MSRLTTEQFQQYFQISGNTAIVSPNVAMIAKLSGDSNFEYLSKKLLDTDTKYDTVLIDIIEGETFPKSRANHELAWLKYSISLLHEGGTLQVKMPDYLCVKLAQLKTINVTHITLFENTAIVRIINDTNYSLTEVQYPDKMVRMNIREGILMQEYNEQHANFLNGKKEIETDRFIQFHHMNNGDKNTVKEMYDKYLSGYDSSKVLFISDGGYWRNPYLLEENPNGKSGCRAVVMNSSEDVQKVKNYLCSQEVKNFIENITFGRTYSLKASIKRVLCNPENISHEYSSSVS
jgi:hypothetical protein